jgi:hypothetical protein
MKGKLILFFFNFLFKTFICLLIENVKRLSLAPARRWLLLSENDFRKIAFMAFALKDSFFQQICFEMCLNVAFKYVV